MTKEEIKSLEETAEVMAKENGWTKERAYNYVRRMTYTVGECENNPSE